METFIDSTSLAVSEFKGKVTGNWFENPHLADWIRECGRENVGNGKLNHAFKPAFENKTGIAPFIDFPVSSILWYQGESNAQEMERILEKSAATEFDGRRFFAINRSLLNCLITSCNFLLLIS